MGTILESVSKHWTYEVHRESWYLGVAGWFDWAWNYADQPAAGLKAAAGDCPGFAVPRSQVPELLLVVGHVIQHQGLTVPEFGVYDQTAWDVATDAVGQPWDTVLFEGPVITYDVGDELTLCQMVEIAYEHTPALCTALKQLEQAREARA